VCLLSVLILVPPAQCLYVLTDDNTPAVEALHADDSAISNLLAIAQAPNQDIVFGSAGSVEQIYSLRVLSCGMVSLSNRAFQHQFG